MDAFTLSADIRSGVTVPICIIILLSSFLRKAVTVLLNSGTAQKSNLNDICKQHTLGRARLLRNNGHFISLESFVNRRFVFTKPETGLLHQVTPPVNAFEMLAQNQDPMAMVSMMKNQIVSIALSAGVGYLISSLFSGFLVAKAPFPLPYKFKSMLQRDIDVPNLEVTFVSSLSWYFFVLISSSNILLLLSHWLGDDEAPDTLSQLTGMMPGAGMMMGGNVGGGIPGLTAGPDISNLYSAERDALNVMVHRSPFDSVTDEIVNKLKKHRY